MTNLSKNGPDSAKEKSSLAVPKLPRDAKADALRRLDVSLESVSRAPNISKLLRETKGGLKHVLAVMRFSNDPFIHRFFEKYDSISESDRNLLSLEAICVAAEIEPNHLLGAAIQALREYSVSKVKIIAVSNHPEITKKRIQFAKLPGGSKDRDAIDTALGFLPTAKGTTFMKMIVNTGTDKPSAETSDASNGEIALTDDVNFSFPDVSGVQDKLSPMRQRLLAEK